MTRFCWTMRTIIAPLGVLVMMGFSIAAFVVGKPGYGLYFLVLEAVWIGFYYWFNWLYKESKELDDAGG
jgi:hypothetical protein